MTIKVYAKNREDGPVTGRSYRAKVARPHGRTRIVVTDRRCCEGIFIDDDLLLVEDGSAIGPRDAGLLGLRVVEASRQERADLRRAGFAVQP